MADSNNGPKFIDGYSSVQAVRRSAMAKGDFKSQPSRSALPAVEKPAPPQTGPSVPASHIGHTAMPEKFDITCYECGFKFLLQGRVIDNFCPKCKKKLLADNHVIEGNWSGSIKTLGTVEFTSTCVLQNADILCRNAIVAGNIKTGRIKINNKLELLPGASLNIADCRFTDIVIREGASFDFGDKVVCRNIDVFGELKAELECSGLINVEPGGFLTGNITGPRLVVKDGGGLRASLKIEVARR